ncbi:dTDP-4-dehydrorhamnose 3,5-epimerase family protein [Rhizobium rhizogenes]|uniref:dTDP-4-dehydrorhamnose 3,5-epimerase family protein n=1 Tax=Rhizobium rhizogenes TaxID=359 RepID=UPI003ED0DF2E
MNQKELSPLDIPTAEELELRGPALPAGVKLHKLTSHEDSRGSFTEIFRNSWDLGVAPVQWNIVRSEANVLRGVHVHREHADYLVVIEGEMVLILHDVRQDSATGGSTIVVRLQSSDLHMAVIPVGVAHGFYFPIPACHIYSVTHGFDGTDEFGCSWQDTQLGLAALCDAPALSVRDSTAGSYEQMIEAFQGGATK